MRTDELSVAYVVSAVILLFNLIVGTFYLFIGIFTYMFLTLKIRI